MKPTKLIAILLLIAAPVFAGSSLFEERGITGSVTSNAARMEGGLYVILFYNPKVGVASDPCGVAGGNFGGGNMTLQYSPDDGVSFFDVEEALLVAATAPVSTTLQVGRGTQFRIVTDSVTCVSFHMAKSQG